MAMSVDKLVDRGLLDEAIRAGEISASHASKQLRINHLAVSAISDALELIKSGRVGHARERLEKVIQTIIKVSAP